MKINDLEHLNIAEQAGFIEGAAYAYAYSSSAATAGFASSTFQAIAIGSSTAITQVGVQQRVISGSRSSSSSASAWVSSFARG